MCERDAEGLASPPPYRWRVVSRYVGVSSHRIFDTADACFASDGICRRVYSRFPTDRDGNYRPISYAQPADPADLPDSGGDDVDARAHGDDDDVRDTGDSGGADAGGGPRAETLPGDDGDTRGGEGVLVAFTNGDGGADSGVPDVRDAGAERVLHEGR